VKLATDRRCQVVVADISRATFATKEGINQPQGEREGLRAAWTSEKPAARHEWFGRNFAWALEVTLTVRIREFFKSWVQGSCRRPEDPSCRCQEDVVLKLLLSGFLANRSAATAIEYGLVMAGIALAILASQRGIGTSISGIFTTLSSSLK